MGRADPCHARSASQTAPHLHPSLPPLAISAHHCAVHLLSKCQDKCSAATSPCIPRAGLTCSAATWYNVMLSLGKDSTLTCCVARAAITQPCSFRQSTSGDLDCPDSTFLLKSKFWSPQIVPRLCCRMKRVHAQNVCGHLKIMQTRSGVLNQLMETWLQGGPFVKGVDEEGVGMKTFRKVSSA